ncbi:MAG: hypothetical protein IJV69_07410 [Kiritimatiellae bacterium]|nr:hypothetical protein [Kiritimatiellia bacterium]
MEGYKVNFNQIVQPQDAYFTGELGGLLNEIEPSLFPTAVLAEDESFVTYHVYDSNGYDVLNDSISSKHKRIPVNCLQRLEKAIDTLHNWAEDPSVPSDRRTLCRSFRLPDPRHYPDAYRLTWSIYPNKRQLHVLWGLQTNGKSILPLSDIAKKWTDVEQRTDVRSACHKSIWQYIFSPKVLIWPIVFGLIFAGLFSKLKNVQIYCPQHNVLVGEGFIKYFSATELCLQRCIICDIHLDENFCCLEHSCKKCHKTKPLPSNHKGYCEDCFWQNGYLNDTSHESFF